MSDRTEAPTPRRLARARAEGDSGASGFGAQAVAFVVAVALAPQALHALAARASGILGVALARAAHPAASRAAMAFDAAELALTVVALGVPVLAAVAAASVVVHVVQTGGTLAVRRIAPRLDRLDPVGGFRRLFSGARLFAVVRALVAGGVVGWLAYRGIVEHLVDLGRVTGRARWVPVLAEDVAWTLAWRAALVGLALGSLDVIVMRGVWLRRMRMSKVEVKREHRDAEGDPQHRAARGRAYQEMLAQATIANVKGASVVVVNPTHLACALRYDGEGGEEAPVVVASGEGDLAARIVQAARDAGVPVVRDVPLARALVELEVGDVIPETLYQAVAEILREVWEEEGR